MARSLTESELIGVQDVMPQIIWTLFFLQAQGQKVADNLLYQDNMSSIQLEKNDRRSCTKRTRHIDIRYSFVKNRVESGEVHIEHCPTLDMLADYFTKSLQGALFLNIDPSITRRLTHVLKNEEKEPDSCDLDVAKTTKVRKVKHVTFPEGLGTTRPRWSRNHLTSMGSESPELEL